MNKYLEQVNEFHQSFDHPTNDINDEISLNLRQLRIKLLFEELEELAEATDCESTFKELCDNNKLNKDDSNNRDKKEELDALADIQYVLSGAILSMGYSKVFDDAFSEVHRSNMSKMCNSLEEVNDTKDWYKEKDNVDSYSVEKGDKYIILRKSDNKILKNKYYSEADLNQFL